MKYKNFEEFLQYKCSEINPTVLDDELPDCFDNWLSNVDIDDVVEYGNEFSKLKYNEGVQDTVDNLPDLADVINDQINER